MPEKQAAGVPACLKPGDPLSQYGIEFLCSAPRFLTSWMVRQRHWKAAVTMGSVGFAKEGDIDF